MVFNCVTKSNDILGFHFISLINQNYFKILVNFKHFLTWCKNKYTDAGYITIYTTDPFGTPLSISFLTIFMGFLRSSLFVIPGLTVSYFTEVTFSDSLLWSLSVPELRTILLPTHFVLWIILPQIFSWSLQLSAASSVEAIFISRISRLYTATEQVRQACYLFCLNTFILLAFNWIWIYLLFY